jgi:hypothetical protein
MYAQVSTPGGPVQVSSPQALGGPVAWPAMSGEQSGAAKNIDTLGVLATAPGGLYVQRQLQLATLLVGFEQRATLYCFNWQPTADEAANPQTTADFSDTVLRMKEVTETLGTA